MPLQRNSILSNTIYDLRQEYLRLNPHKTKQKLWSSVLETEQYHIITVVIPTRGCSWALSESGGCSVCGYINDSSRTQSIPTEQILDEIQRVLNKIDSPKPIILKLFNSGSFFDENDVPRELRIQIIDLIKGNLGIIKFVVESRPEYLLKNNHIVEEVSKFLEPVKLEIGLGLESSNNAILRDNWNKGSSFEDYRKSIQTTRSQNILIKTYILIKPPFLTEVEAIIDTIKTVKDAVAIGTDVISLNPCTVQNGTLIHFLHKQNRYHPPWLWSVLFIIKTIRKIFPDLDIICEPTATGKLRGTHNCGKCEKIVMNLIMSSIKKEKINEDFSSLCSCYSRWKLLVETPIEVFRIRNLSKLRKLNPLRE